MRFTGKSRDKLKINVKLKHNANMYKFKTLKNREQLTDTIDIKRSKNIQVG